VPHGEYTTRVAVLAAAAGIEFLFTSTPATQPFTIDGCAVYGRFSVQRRTTASQAAAFALGDRTALLRQRLFWEVKRFAKATSRPLYDQTRRLLLARS
ncbi:MAG: hypothetical protein ACREJX_21230, partial [Polyangiaceae bacterium]